MRTIRILLGLAATAGASVVHATTVPLPVPEPGALELLAAGAIAGLVVWARNRRK